MRPQLSDASRRIFTAQFGLVLLVAGLVALLSYIAEYAVQLADASHTLGPAQAGPISIVPLYNNGAAFSFGQGYTWLFVLIFAVVFVASLFLTLKEQFSAHTLVFWGIFLGGALANCIDRLRFGAVFDYIQLNFISFPIFNLADIAITMGCVLTVVSLIARAIFIQADSGQRQKNTKHKRTKRTRKA